MSWEHMRQAVPTLNFLREFTKFERLDIPVAFNDFFCTFAQGLVLLVCCCSATPPATSPCWDGPRRTGRDWRSGSFDLHHFELLVTSRSIPGDNVTTLSNRSLRNGSPSAKPEDCDECSRATSID